MRNDQKRAVGVREDMTPRASLPENCPDCGDPEHEGRCQTLNDWFVASNGSDPLCEGCPPIGYPTDATRCSPCPRRVTTTRPEAARDE